MKLFLDIGILKRNRNYRLLYSGQFISFIGTMMTSVALPYQIYSQTHSTLMVGLLSLVQLIPLLFTALIGGAFADRHQRRQLALYSEMIFLLSCLTLIINAGLTHPHIWILFAVSPIMSAMTGLHRPALMGMTQQIVDKKDLATLGGLSTFMYGFNGIVGPAIAGILVAHVGLIFTYLVDAATFIISISTLFMLNNIPAPTKPEQKESTLASIKKGVSFAKSRQELLGTYFVDFIAMIFGMPNALFPAIAQTLGGVQILGLLYAAPAVGALIASCFTGWYSRIKRQGVGVAIAASLWGVAIIGFGFSHQLGLSLFFLMLAGGFDGISGIFRSALWNESIPNEFRGRLAGIEMISYLSGPKLGDTESGLVAAAFGVTASVVSGGILCIVGVGLCCYFMPKFWRYRSAI